MLDKSLIVVLSTVPDSSIADTIAQAVVEERLAACVNILPRITSVYHWEGKIERSEEILLIIKTTATSYKALEARIIALHPYDTPEVLALESKDVSSKYLQWAIDSVSG